MGHCCQGNRQFRHFAVYGQDIRPHPFMHAFHCSWRHSACRIGEAKKPGPSICSVNPGGWSRVSGTLGLGHDVVVVQETFLIRDALATGHFLAKQHGYSSVFTPAKKPAGRGRLVGGLAVLCKKHNLCRECNKGLHIFNVYGYSSDNPRAPELNHELCLDLFAAVAAVGRQVINRPLSTVIYTSPQGEVHTDWILCSKALLPACGAEEETDKKPDHRAIKLNFDLELVSHGYMGQRSYENAERSDPLEMAVEYRKQRDQHLARWSTALTLVVCRAAEQALGLPALSRGKLNLSKQQLLEQAPDDEAVASAKQHDQVTDLRRKLLDTGACTFFEWPAFLGEIPPTVEAQYACLDAWITGKKKKEQAERSASWRAYVKEAWERSPKKIYKRIRGNASVWDLAILHYNGYALSPDQTAQAELNAWSTRWKPGVASFPNKTTCESSWRTGDLRKVIDHCPLGKARGVDRWSIGELRLLPDIAILDLATMLKHVEIIGVWPEDIREICPKKELEMR
eukprot:5014677-Amphidinium_carterae.1